MTFLNKVKNINHGLLKLSNTIMTKTRLFGDSSVSDSTNTLILNTILDTILNILNYYIKYPFTIDYVIATKRFDEPIVT